MERIEDPADPRLEALRAVRDPEAIRARGLFVAEGRRAVEEVLARMPGRVEALLLTDAAAQALEGRLAGVPAGSGLLRVPGPADVREVTGVRFHQGCLAVVRLPPPRRLVDVPDLTDPGPRLVVALEAVSDPDNVGGIFRSAAAFGADGVLLGPGCAHPLYRKAVRTSLGATLRLPFAETDEAWPADLRRLAAAGFAVLGLAPAGGPGLDEVRPGERVAVVAGSEGRGLTPEALACCRHAVRIPMAPSSDSLNVGVAVALALHRWTPHHGTRVR